LQERQGEDAEPNHYAAALRLVSGGGEEWTQPQALQQVREMVRKAEIAVTRPDVIYCTYE